MRLSKCIWFGAFVALMASCGKSNQQTGPKELPVYPGLVITKQNATLSKIYPVQMKGQQDIEIRPRIDGTIKNVFVNEGATVVAGQKLFEIDSPQAEQGLRTAEAAVASAQAQVQTALINVNRIKPLADEGIVSDVQYLTAKNSYDTALASLEQAKASLYNAKEVKSWTIVTSPVNGMINSIPYRHGSLVSASNVLTTVANTKDIYAYFSIDETELMIMLQDLPGSTQAEKIQNIPPVQLQLKDGTMFPFEGKLSAIDGMVNTATGTAMLRADFPNSDKLLRSGYSGKVIISDKLNDTIVIPQTATYRLQNEVLVYKIQNDSIAKSTVVKVVPTPDGKDYVVTSGLKVGDFIVKDGLATLRDNMVIKPTK